ncbi:MAG: exosortase/archaeosortase family protein [Pirellulales bacterium]|nr:exosortase/archaeosortase family protein [Pirellulales bacterium]
MRHIEDMDNPASGQGSVRETVIVEQAMHRNLLMAVAIILAIGSLFTWAYWPTLVDLEKAWDRVPDNSHGYMVVPLAVFFLWIRRDRYPTKPGTARWLGVILIVMSMSVRYLGAKYYLGSVDAWSIMIWIAGVVLLFGGHRVLIWAAPSIIFLFFMVPLPFGAERMFSLPLQKLATLISCWTLQFLGQPAIAQGNTILLGEHQLEVAQACCGLRIFMGIIALAFAYIVIVRCPWWQKMILVLSTIPIALIANATRIVFTGLLYQLVSGEAAQHFSHDLAGWVMIPFAALLFAVVLWYLSHTVQEVEDLDVSSLIVGDEKNGDMQLSIKSSSKEPRKAKSVGGEQCHK